MAGAGEAQLLDEKNAYAKNFYEIFFSSYTFLLTFRGRFLYSRSPKEKQVGGKNVDNFEKHDF